MCVCVDWPCVYLFQRQGMEVRGLLLVMTLIQLHGHAHVFGATPRDVANQSSVRHNAGTHIALACAPSWVRNA
jgi:hypothetical protein